MPIPIFTELPCRFLAVLVTFLIAGGLSAQVSGDASELAQKELQRRMLFVQEGQMLLSKGDEAYNSGKFKEASDAYAGALSAFPDASTTAELKEAAMRRYVLASVEYGRELSRKGDVEGAKAAVDKVLEESVAPNDPYAKSFRAELDDPIRTNPAITKEHAADIDEVRRLLYTAQGAFDLGKFDEAQKRYEDVLRIDPFNKAARRGMELVASRKSSYLESARDHTRAEALGMVDAAWELPLAPDQLIPALPDGQQGTSTPGTVPLDNKIKRIIVPKFQIVQGTLMEAIDLLRLRTSENDTFSTDPGLKGINIAVNLGDPTESPAKEILAKTFDLQVNNVPVEAILKYITNITGTSFKTDDFAVTILPVGNYSEDLISRNFRVPPDFLSNLTAGSNVEKKSDDIFNTDIGKGGLLAERISAQQALAEQGVTFPQGAFANFNAATSTLSVVNTASNLDIIGQIIDLISQTEPVAVAVRVKVLKVEEDRLVEQGFDWMLNPFGFGGADPLTGVDRLNLSGGTTGNGSAITDIAPQIGFPFIPTNPITAGNRSGDGAFGGDTIGSLIAAGSTGGRQQSNRAPGVLGLNGVIDNTTLQLVMRGLNQKKGVDLMSQPSVTTRSGQAASIKIIREFIYPTEYEPPELPNAGGVAINIGPGGVITGTANPPPSIVIPSMPTAFESRDVGVSLDVLPVADANRRYIDVTLNPVVTDFDGFVNYGSPINQTLQTLFGPLTQTLTENQILMPVFSVRRAQTNILIEDGATIVIAGLLKDEISTVDDKTPILGDIPLMGRLFKSEAKSHRSVAIIFLVNVELLDPTGRPYKDR